MASLYSLGSKGALKLKGVSDKPIKKKKKKEKLELIEKAPSSQPMNDEESSRPKAIIRKTKAELAFLEMKRKKELERISLKAAKTHKDRVEEFNRHLDSLTEHFDIPKVSWTK